MPNRGGTYLGILQVIVAIGAIPAGLSMILDPSGNDLGISPDILRDAPFRDFYIPGIFLLVGNGVFNIIGAVLSFRKNKQAGKVGLGLGIFLVLWICFQIYFIGFIHFLQPLFLVIGIIEILLSYAYISNEN
jgi:hypothetical protein